MPLTPFHYPIAYLIYKVDNRFSLPALIVGAMFPDLEIPFIIMLLGTQVPDRMILHSLLGAVTLGALLSMIVTNLLYPPIISPLFKIEKRKIQAKCKLSPSLFISALLGNISHVLLDITTHLYNPIFWPFLQTNENLGVVCNFLGGPENASLIVHTAMTILFLIIVATNTDKNLKERLLIG